MGSGRDRIAVAAALAVIVLLAVIAPPAAEYDRWDRRLSSYRSSPYGARALYLTLRELDVPVDRRVEPFIGGDALGDGPIAVLAPAHRPTPAELRALYRWVDSGGMLVYAAVGAGDAMLDSLGLRLVTLSADSAAGRPGARPVGRARPAAAHEWTRGLASVDGFRRAFHDSSAVLVEGRATPLLATDDGAVVVLVFRRGRGTVVAWSDGLPLANRSIRESGAAVPFARMAADGTEPGRPLRFDEYHQGYRGDGRVLATTARFLRDSPTGHGVLQLAAAGLLLLLLYGRRLGEPLPGPSRAPRSTLEHVDALAVAYRQASARSTVRRLLIAGLARRLGRPAPDGPADHARLLAALERRRSVDPAHLRAVRKELVSRDRADLVALARGIDHLLEGVHRQ